MITLLPDDFKPLVVTQSDLVIASIAWGFTLGFGFLTTWTAIKQTSEVGRQYGYSRVHSPYIVMIWLEILVCMVFCIICWLHLNGNIPPSFAFFFVILTTWALQVQFLLQIIINRVAILLTDKTKAMKIKIAVAVLITAINISVYCIWIPARLQISERYININEIWDRCEKCIYLLVDGALNYYFIRIVKSRLVHQGLIKYDRLVHFNQGIVVLSLSMDCLIIGTMSLNNGFVYMQFHPVAYMVKLNIEMSMAEMIVRIASDKENLNVMGHHHNSVATSLTKTFGTSKDVNWKMDSCATGASAKMGDITFNAKREVHVVVERRKSVGSSSTEASLSRKTWDDRNYEEGQEDLFPLKEQDSSKKFMMQGASNNITGIERAGGMGMTVKIWGPPETKEFYP
ncbi:hypothetical protein ONS95_014612 [Cadophora gregata]|uniref:uncharacterized protein n=1 Tax=Cadophora gregata TaxID=51156 RepID=UPI0026DD9640|nr:uncharacterized protein ONS95_014612 [Cadophora gregata]KAK0112891.1 hypothetical protein ONS95_014612 [Cadophora gregata]KAK0125019.1 hypothetical protein ONS96_008886 [Cadophora gregata f. sp. sojae]